MKLRLKAQDADDLQVVASVLQDAVVAVRTLSYDRTAMAFTLQGSRFRHEGAGPERVFTGLRIDNVTAAAHRGIDMAQPDAFAVLLDLAFESGDAPGGVLTLVFAGGGEIRLEVEAVDAILADVGEVRKVRAVPEHD